MTVHFTSDLHLGHERVAAIRGFDSVEEHDAAVAESWRSSVRKDDDVFVLGDVTGSTSRRAVAHAIGILAGLPGRKHLIAGNHDAVHPLYRDAHKRLGEYLPAFASVASAARRRIEGREVLLSHFPYERDRDEIRHAQWRLRDEGLPLLHGHTHGDERLTVTDAWSYFRGESVAKEDRVELHVGLDAWGLQLVPLDTVADLLAHRTTPTLKKESTK